MEQYPFIFSNSRRYRIRRHLAFWLFWMFFMSLLYAFLPGPGKLSYFDRLPNTMMDSVLFLPSHMFLSYSLMYFVIPRYVVHHKYRQAALITIGAILLTGMLAALISMFIVEPVEQFVLPEHLLMKSFVAQRTILAFCLASMAGLRGGITIGGLAAAIKLMKHWYVKEQMNLKLQKENAESKLQVLKAQLHPHFLFNTLNNIYSNTQYKAPEAAEMICGLSDMLRYMLYECNTQSVPLAKELKLVQEYVSLEQVRYGNKLEVHMDLPEETSEYFIAPLLLLPFVENCFKHGISHVLEQPWLNLSIAIQGREMTMKLMNSKPIEHGREEASGIGIANAENRLALLYPGKHQLTIREEEEMFIVVLKLQLDRIALKTIHTATPAFETIS